MLRVPAHLKVVVASRQDLPVLPSTDLTPAGVTAGGYVRWQHGDGGDLAIIATGSEVHLAIDAATQLAEQGVNARVVSMPCVEWFAEQTADYRESVLPTGLRARVAVEAGRGDAWYRWVGLDGQVVSVEEFGESGSGPEVLRLRGLHLEAVLAAAHATLAAVGEPATTPGTPELVAN